MTLTRSAWSLPAPLGMTSAYRNEVLGVVNWLVVVRRQASLRDLEGVGEVLDGTPKRFVESYGRRDLTSSFRYFFFCAKRRPPDRSRGVGVTGAGPAIWNTKEVYFRVVL